MEQFQGVKVIQGLLEGIEKSDEGSDMTREVWKSGEGSDMTKRLERGGPHQDLSHEDRSIVLTIPWTPRQPSDEPSSSTQLSHKEGRGL